jgi:hypothetical protein
MKVLYRFSDGGYNKIKPSYVSKRGCFLHFLQVFKNYDIYLFADNVKDETFQFFKFVFGEKNRIADHISYEKYNHHDFDYMVIQLSQMWRNRFYYDKNDLNKFINVPLHNLSELEKRYPDFLKWFYNSDKTFDDCQESMMEQQFLRLKNEVMFYEEKGIKVRILSWQNDLVNQILKDPYLSERFIKLKYKN